PEQTELAWSFANASSRNRDKFVGLSCEGRETGSPILADCLAWFDCRVFARYDSGDRLLFWADIVLGTRNVPNAERPLREHQFFRNLTDEQRHVLIADRDTDVAIQRPQHEIWRIAKPW